MGELVEAALAGVTQGPQSRKIQRLRVIDGEA
jgi:hypothetical protein